MKKNLLTVLILALLIVNIALTGVLMFSVMSTNKKTAELVTNIATVMNLELATPSEDDGAPKVSLADTEVYNLNGAMTIPLAAEVTADGKTKQSYIVMEIALSMDTKNKDYKKYSDLSERESLIKDAITSVVSAHTESECRDDYEGLKAEILTAIQQLFQSDFIYQVSINNIKYG